MTLNLLARASIANSRTYSEALYPRQIYGTLAFMTSKSTDMVLRTKLHAPPTPVDMVQRDYLLERLEAGRERPLTLVSAPAGYGKSVLITNWLERCDWVSTWLSLDNDDGDLRQFLIYLVAAVRKVFPNACEQTLSHAEAVELPALKTVATVLSNELDVLDQPFILVLDDYHRIDVMAPVNELLDRLLSHPPIPLHLVIVTRIDPALPLERLRALGQITDIRMLDLRFDKADTAALLEKTLRAIPGDAALRNLEYELEGWVVGLRLVVIAMSHSAATDELFECFGDGTRDIQQYLVNEVVTRLPESLHNWLLKTSILDRFCAPLCDAVCAETDATGDARPDSNEFLKTAFNANLFLIPLDTNSEWFRYHHLFQNLIQRELMNQLSRGEIAALHLRASEWFEAENLIDESLHHALAAEDLERAVAVVERQARPVRNEGKWYKVSKWLSWLPDEAIQKRPELLISQAWIHYYHLDFSPIAVLLDRIDDLMDGDVKNYTLSGEVAVFHSFFELFSNYNSSQSLKYVEHALDRIPLTESESRAQAEILFAIAGQSEGQKDRVIAAETAWLEDYPLHPLRKNSLLWSLFYVHYLSGDLQGARQYCRTGQEVARTHGINNFLAWHQYFEALLHLQWGELDLAIVLLEQAVKQKYYHYPRAAVDAQIALTLAYQLRGQSAQASTTLHKLEEFVDDLGPSFLVFAESCMARLALMQNKPESAVRWLKTSSPGSVEMMVGWLEIPAVTRCRVLIAEGSADSLREAKQKLQDYAEMNESNFNTNQNVGILALQALANAKQSNDEEALAVLGRAITLARPGGFLFPFLELGQPMAALLGRLAEQQGHTAFLCSLLDAFQIPRASLASITVKKMPAYAAWSGEPLTKRESAILAMLVQRLQNKEIAARLFVSPETVKSHLKHLYQKLGVHNRREAAAIADQSIVPNAKLSKV